MTDQQETDKRLAALVEELCHAYHYGVGLTELEEEAPEEAAAHRQAAVFLARYLENMPREEKRAAFQRGYDRGRDNAKKTTAEQMRRLEAEVAELRQDRDPDALRARIADLQYVNRGWERLMHGTTAGQSETADLLTRLQAAQRELAELKGVQPSNATGERPS